MIKSKEIENSSKDGIENNSLFSLDDMPHFSRRKFLALVSASAAFTYAGCNMYKNKGEIISYNKKPDQISIGNPNYYASTCDACQNSCGIIIKTREGRPIKIDGNPENPLNNGKICAKGQANIFNLYDPERLSQPLRRQNGKLNPVSWLELDKELLDRFKNATNENKEIAFILGEINSPTQAGLLEEFKSVFPNTVFYYSGLFNSSLSDSAFNECFSVDKFPLVDISDKKIILSIDNDFLGSEGHYINNINKYSSGKDFINNKYGNRLYVVEGRMSLTGSNADYRIRLSYHHYLQLLSALINNIIEKKKLNYKPVNSSINLNLDSVSRSLNIKKSILETLVNDLINNVGKSVVLVGEKLPLDIQKLAHYLNEILEANKTIYWEKENFSGIINYSQLNDLSSKIVNNKVAVLIDFNSNPIYNFPGNLTFSEIIAKVSTKIIFTQSKNETTETADFVIPINHTLESWGDYSVIKGIISLQQPTIEPLFKTRQKETTLLSIINLAKSLKNIESDDQYHLYMKKRWETNIFSQSNSLLKDFSSFWISSLHDGVCKLTEPKKLNIKFNSNSITNINISEKKNSKLSLQLFESYHLGDGKFSNNGWLQELPHPISKIVWDNYLSISAKTAKEFGVSEGDIVEIITNSKSERIPVFIQPGHADDVVSIELGYGRKNSGTVAEEVGKNFNIFINSVNQISPWIIEDIELKKTGEKHQLVSAQENHSIEDTFLKDLAIKRKIVREGTLKDYNKNDQLFEEHHLSQISITESHEYKDVKWAMSIDLNKCIGCNACISSCNVENNITIVGKEQINKGRDMMWIRLDRYYSGSEDDLSVHHQPMLCQQCDNAPCENVCPVVATTHSPDGLNQMTYNRCVGTRYCSNNCPYKVRRFNFLDFRSEFKDGYMQLEPVNYLLNPEVTVRSRGVMEKCTFCVQRLSDAKQKAIERGEKFIGTGVTTACQEACPSDAINFGNMLDSKSEISKLRKHSLGYYVLEELKVMPNVTYLAKLRNIEEEKHND